MTANDLSVLIVTWMFWVSAAAVVYVYLGYPLCLWLLSRVFGAPPVRPEIEDEKLPHLSIVIAAHNEETCIEERLDNLMALDYPRDRLEIVIASDGSTDATCAIVRKFADAGARLLEFAENRGKAAVLNDAVRAARGDVVLLSDANTAMEPGAARAIARWFKDPHIGVVCGKLVLNDPATGQNVDGMYWKYETFLKHCEARLDALLGANGAIYAVRRSLFPQLPKRVAIDDFVVPLLARLRSGGRIVYEPEAVAFEETPRHIGDEFTRRSRIGAGGFQSLSLLWPIMHPRQGWVAFAFVSHKLLRWLCPFFLLGTAAGSLALVANPVYGLALLAQVVLYLLALAGYFSRHNGTLSRSVRLATMFVTMNLALMAGFLQWVFRRQSGTWQRTVRAGT